MKFDTRDRKPKLYIELILLFITAAAVALIMIFAGERGLPFASLVIAAFFVVSVFVFLGTYRKQVQYNPYSYNTIFYLGFALFILSIAISMIVHTVRCFTAPEVYEYNYIMDILMHSARNFMILSAPFILVFAVALFISNISLIRHETRRVQNFLGMLLAVLMLCGEAALFFFDYYTSGSVEQILAHELFWNFFASVYLYFECMIIGSIVAGLMSASYTPERNKDFIIILGCRVGADGKPLPLLKGRIDKALEFYRRQIEETGKRAVFVPAGGRGSDEVISESECMRNYLIEQGVPEEDILIENRSETTMENLKYSRQVIMDHLGDPGQEALLNNDRSFPGDEAGKVIFATTNYHVFRSGLLSRRIKFRTIGIGAKTKWYFWPNASVREFIGLLTGHKLKQALILFALVAAYTVLPLIVYL